MNIKSASGFPTPNTVCVREQARCAHFVHAATRSRIGVSNSALFDVAVCPLGTMDSTTSVAVACAVLRANGRAPALALCSRASTVCDARGARSLSSRIFSSAAITKSRAGSGICGRLSKILHPYAIFFGLDGHHGRWAHSQDGYVLVKQ